jgi:hypothetical protein
VVGLGSVCRRQDTGEVEALARELTAGGLRLHGFGFKTKGLRRLGGILWSADSMAWSYSARAKKARHPQCNESHKTCANCLTYALGWRKRLLS